MLKVIIIDDESAARQTIKKILEMYLHDVVEIVETADNLTSGITAIKKHAPDVVFLDISMPHDSGLDLFDYFGEIKFDVILVTAHQQYAIDAVGLGASGYILKPVKPKQIVDAVLKTQYKLNKSKNNIPDRNIGYNTQKLLVNHQKGVHIVSYNEIIAIIADGNYCKIFKINETPLYVSRTIGSIEENLPNNHFFRTHRSSIANLNYITEIDKEKNIVHLSDNIEVPLSSANFKSLIEELSKLTNKSL